MYVRFVHAAPTQNAYLANGIFTASQKLLEDLRLERYELDVLNETFDWFNRYMPCPPFRKMRRAGIWSHNAVCWYRHSARHFIRRMWEMAELLREHGEPVRFVTTPFPGTIVYRDAYQVVAETPQKAFRRRTEWKL